jgi:hypothetical protein
MPTIYYVAAAVCEIEFVYGQDGPMEARYDVDNVTDLEGNVIGNRRADIKTVTIPGSSTSTYSVTTVINDKTFIYLVGTKSTVLVSGGIQLVVYENITVQQVVVDGNTYTEASITIVPILDTDLVIVTIKY